MFRLIIFLVFIVCVSCNNNDGKEIKTTSKSNDSLINNYYDILKGLKLDYVFYYRHYQKMNLDSKTSGLTKDDSVILKDSLKYEKSYDLFFKQDYRFIDWLLQFKKDTTEPRTWDGYFFKPLWSTYSPTYSSHISECDLFPSNSRAAIILLENFLNGNGFRCYECPYNTRFECNNSKYEEIETFLSHNKGKTIDELRTE